MEVAFKRLGPRKYAVRVQVPGRPAQWVNPAPGCDDDIPHDLVHYVVEAELGFRLAVFGRAAAGGGTFIGAGQTASPRERARQARKQRKREGQLSARDDAGEMQASERLAGICDVHFRRRHGQQPDPSRQGPPPLNREDAARVERVVARLEKLAPLWRVLPVDSELVFEWPSAEPSDKSYPKG
jgi:hypothetical protein